MTDIDVSKIRAGDSVRVRVPADFTGVVLDDGTISCAIDIRDEQVTIKEHAPARPDWADAQFIRAGSRGQWLTFIKSSRCGTEADFYSVTGTGWSISELRDFEVEILLDADGNPPEAEVEWLDPDALDELPMDSITISQSDWSWPRWKGHDGMWRHTGASVSSDRGGTSREIAPARVLWDPEAGR